MRTICTSVFSNLRVNWVGNPDKGGINFTGTFVDAENGKNAAIKFRVWNENMAVFNTANVHSGKLVDVVAELRSTGEYVVRHIAPAANAVGQAANNSAAAPAAQKATSVQATRPALTPEEQKMQQFKSVANDVFAHGLAHL